ncbi:putative oxidoreductase C26F1.07 [Colletotrichum gloeosporioides]|uniref:Putative oxidoreductase C26F1.07 n=1 Tax=Colletotrichum gloeosporioides TaxID=474922 RepID=A0A8H4CP29_COLGL|nr:putative oxidoreductase C26F1.07 [Colletotrichum gloeosporioides]KAF3807222.1 putative oxidoreductase C26F1.07 [Colletotrichum gloeosporioides]
MATATGMARYKGRTVTLNTGQILPSIGLGTFQDPDEQEMSVYTALKNGYRHIDTAHNYGTEEQVGRGIRRSGVSRDEVFITTKLWCNSHHPDDVEPALDDSLRDLGVDYVDLYLMHYPCAFKRGPDLMPMRPDGKIIPGSADYVDTWKAMEKLLPTGKVKAIGVSNFNQLELERILKDCSIHLHDLTRYLIGSGYSPNGASSLSTTKGLRRLARKQGNQDYAVQPERQSQHFYRDVSWTKDVAQMARLIGHPILQAIAQKHGKSPIQIALAWGVGNGRCVIPKSTIEWQIKENLEADSIPLDKEDLQKIAKMDQKARFNDPTELFGYKLYVGLDGAAP